MTHGHGGYTRWEKDGEGWTEGWTEEWRGAYLDVEVEHEGDGGQEGQHVDHAACVCVI